MQKKLVVGICCFILLGATGLGLGIRVPSAPVSPSPLSAHIQIEVITGGFGVSAAIRNVGDANLTNITWSIGLTGGLVLLGKTAQGTIPILYREKSELVKIPFVVGLGKTVITAVAQSAEGSTDTLTTYARIHGIRVIITPGGPGPLVAKLTRVVKGLMSPTVLTNAHDGTDRLFVAQQSGTIEIIQNGTLLTQPFLDLTSKVVKISKLYDERGLLGLVFHPDYKNNGRFFVYYSAKKNGTGIDHEAIIAEYRVSADLNIADPASEQVIFRVDEPEMNHNGGQLAFGPDGFLYIGFGDGGGAGDQHGSIGNAQNISVPLGKILRIDVDSGAPYSIPSDNPFVGVPGLDEIYAYGFRNPYKFSFDMATGTLFAADVGQDTWEEVDIVEKGGNYGWRILEGDHPYDLALAQYLGINLSLLQPPIYDYSHNVGHSIIGGYVYRGNQSPSLQGKYVLGDWSNSFTTPGGKLYYLDEVQPDQWVCSEFILKTGRPLHRFIQGFGVDEHGEIYMLTTQVIGSFLSTGEVWHIQVK